MKLLKCIYVFQNELLKIVLILWTNMDHEIRKKKHASTWHTLPIFVKWLKQDLIRKKANTKAGFREIQKNLKYKDFQ